MSRTETAVNNAIPLRDRIPAAAFVFRGYNVTNLGRTGELLDHAVYGPIVEQTLAEGADVAASILGRPVDLLAAVRDARPSTLETYEDDVALIVSVELAHLRLLRELFGIKIEESRLLVGYSLGEAAALVAAGVFELAGVLTPLLKLAGDSADLGRDTRMGVVFSRGPAVSVSAIRRLCLEITNEGNGTIAISTILSPNSVLVMGQGATVERFKQRMGDVLPKSVHLRGNPHLWPPMHTPITRQRQIADRAGVILETMTGGFQAPKPPIVSCVTGQISYNDHNARETLVDWVDHPQLLWDAVEKILAEGCEVVVHVGAEPNLVPATLERLANNVTAQLSGRSLGSLGRRAVSAIVRRRRWLTNVLSKDASLLRAPFVEQIMLEDWLLAHPKPEAG